MSCSMLNQRLNGQVFSRIVMTLPAVPVVTQHSSIIIWHQHLQHLDKSTVPREYHGMTSKRPNGRTEPTFFGAKCIQNLPCQIAGSAICMNASVSLGCLARFSLLHTFGILPHQFTTAPFMALVFMEEYQVVVAVSEKTPSSL